LKNPLSNGLYILGLNFNLHSWVPIFLYSIPLEKSTSLKKNLPKGKEEAPPFLHKAVDTTTGIKKVDKFFGV
jgi:hypothetical protein